MKSYVKYLAITAAAFAIGLSVNNFAMSDANSKIAVVDVQKVVNASSQVQSLKADREKKIKDLTAFVENAKAAVNKETNATAKKALEDKYNKELNAKTETIQKEYAAKLAEIDKNISGVVAAKAKAANYDIVLAKGVVLYGGTDITADVSKSVK